MINYLVIEIAADNINVTHTPAWSVSPYSISSFLHAFQEKTNSRCGADKFFVEGFSVIQQSLQGYSGMLSGAGVEIKYKKHMVTDKTVDAHAINHRIPYKLLASGAFALIIEADFPDIDVLDPAEFKKTASNTLQQMKFLDGTIFRQHLSGPFSTETEVKKHLQDNGCSGLMYQLNDEALQDYVRQGCSPAEALLWSTQTIIDRDNRKLASRPGSNFASLIGYQLLEAPRKREGTRDSSHRHAYAEPVFSVIKRVPAGHGLGSEESLRDQGLVWQKRFHAETNTLYVGNQ